MKQRFSFHWASGLRPLAKAVSLGLLAAGAAGWWATPARAVSRIWTGSANAFWSEPTNWSPTGAPQNGDSLIFPGSAVNYDSLNDLTSLRLVSISLNGGGYNLTGNDILLDSDLSDNHSTSASNRVSITIYFTAAGSINVVGAQRGSLLEMYGQVRTSGSQPVTFFINAFDGGGQPGYLTLHDAIVTSGPVIKLGDGPLYIRNKNPNICNRGMYFLQGTVHLLGLQVSVPAPGPLVIGSNGVSQATVYVGANQWTADLAIEINNSELYLNYNAQIGYLTMREGAIVDGPGSFTVYGGIEGISDSVTPAIQVPFGIFHDHTGFYVHGANYAGLDVQTSIGGPGGISQGGDSALLLEKSNTFAGNIEVYGGILDSRDPGALGFGTNVLLYNRGSLTIRNMTVSGKTLQVYGQEQITSELAGSKLTVVGACSWNAPVILQTNLIVLGGDLAFTGPISGSGGLSFLNGTAILGGSEGNTYTGTTLVRCPLLELNKPYQVNAFAGPLVIGGPTGGPYEVRWLNWYQNPATSLTLFANGLAHLNSMIDRFIDVTFNGGRIETGSGQFVLGDFFSANPSHLTVNASTSQAIMNGYFQAAGGPCLINVADGVADPDLLVNSIVSGAIAQIIKQGPGTMRLTGPNTYIATTIVSEGILDAAQIQALGSSSFGTIVSNLATLRLSGSDTMTEGLALSGAGVGGTSGALQVTGSPTLTGAILLNAASTINIAQSAGLAIDSVISGTGSLTKIGPGNLHLTGNNTYLGTNLVNGGTFWVDGVQPQTPVQVNAGTLFKGSGTVGHINYTGSSGVVAPGSSPGFLTCSNFNSDVTGGGSLQIELNGTTPGSGHDQINANGTVNLTGLSLSATRSFSPAQEDSFTIINNDGIDPVSGTFNGLRQDTQVRIGNEAFHVNYAGGTGNDVVLTRRGHDITWINNSSGDWNVAANWSPNLVPGTNDTVFILKGVTVTLNTDVEIYSLTFGDAAGSPTLTGTGTLTIGEAATWERGTMSGSGRTIIATGATLSIANTTFTLGLSTRTLENGGTVLWTGANISLLSSAVITNRAGALFEIQGTGAQVFGGGTAPRFDNAGIFRKSVNTGTTPVGQVPFNNYGTVEIQTGTLLFSGSFINNGVVNLSAGTTNRMAANGSASGTFNAPAAALVEWTGGTFTLNTGAQLNGAGLYRINGGSVTFNTDIVVANLDLVIATLSGTGTLTVSNLMNWTGGTMSGSGRTIIPTGATLNVANASAVSLTGGRTFENGGTVLWTGANISLLNSAVITNRTGALFDIQGAGAPIFGGGAVPRFDNAGIFRKSANTGTTTVGQVPFNNYGTVEIQTGTLVCSGSFTNNGAVNLSAGATNRMTANGLASGTFNAPVTAMVEWTGGTFTLDSGAKLNGGGLYKLNGGNVTCNTDIEVANLDLVSATLSGPGIVTVSNLMNWTGGTMSGSGRTIIAPVAALNLANASSVSLNTRTLENGGTVLWTGVGNIGFTSAVITNRAGAVFETRGAGALNFGFGSGSRFDNAGIFRKSVNTGTTTAVGGVAFNNYNTVEIQTGILAANGGYTSTANSLLNCAIGGTTAGTGYGQLQVSGAVALNGSLGVSLANGFLPTTNDTFTVLTAGTRNGKFANFAYPSNEVTMVLSNNATSVIVRVSEVLVVPQPILHIELLPPSSVRILWPTNDPPFRLQSNTNLNTAAWISASPPPVVLGTNNVVTNSTAGGERFYRLINP